jgi:uncharacterized membrane protein YjjP (DUF1212 family)
MTLYERLTPFGRACPAASARSGSNGPRRRSNFWLTVGKALLSASFSILSAGKWLKCGFKIFRRLFSSYRLGL